MRVLIDESLPIALTQEFPTHDLTTVRAQRWLGLRNGSSAADAGFQVLLTADRALRDRQNLPRIGIAVVLVVRVRNRMSDLRPLLPRIAAALNEIEPGQLIEIAGTRR